MCSDGTPCCGSGLFFQRTGRTARRCRRIGAHSIQDQGKCRTHYDVHLYPNDFPGFSPGADPFVPETMPGLLGENGPRGACDVVLYSPEHTLAPSRLTLENWGKIVDVWTKRTAEHAANPEIAMVCVFENCGEAVGVTMPHPHGQIYAIPFIAPMMEKEIESARLHGEINRR